MTPLEIAQQYFDAWNRHDAAAAWATFAETGSYSDPTTRRRLSGEAFRGYMDGLFQAFPDASFEVVSAGLAAPDLVAAQWIMRGTNTGPMSGLPPTGRKIELAGADFIRVANGKILTVDGYFDSRAIPEQIGLQVEVQPRELGPFSFGTAARAWNGKRAQPGAFSVTMLRARSPEEVKIVTEQSRKIASEMLGMAGFLGFVGITIGDRMMTVSAWESPENPRQLMRGRHAEAMKLFFGPELASGGFTSVWTPARVNTMWTRCACGRMEDSAKGVCACGATLPEAPAYW